MKCFYCSEPACAKVGKAKGSIINALLNRQAWEKEEIYVCREHFEKRGK